MFSKPTENRVVQSFREFLKARIAKEDIHVRSSKERKDQGDGLPGPTKTLEAISRLEQDMERMFHEFWRRPFLSLWEPERWWPSRTLSFKCQRLMCTKKKTMWWLRPGYRVSQKKISA
jgi:hypothetical protein